MARARSSLLAAVVFAGLAACTSSAGPVDAGVEPDRIPITIAAAEGDVVFQVEIADTPEERQRGLMFREEMDDAHGMLFLFPDEKPRSFWMKNTYISLDIIFIRADRTILGIVANTEPRTLTGRSVPGDSQFVLELNAGLAERHGLAADQEVRFVAPLPNR